MRLKPSNLNRYIKVTQRITLHHSGFSGGEKFAHAVVIILLIMTPLPFLANEGITPFKETVFDGSGYVHFFRPFNQYLFLINTFICFYLFVIYALAANSFQYSQSTRLNDILSFSLSPLYTVKALMKTNPIGAVMGLILISLFLFSTLLIITELGWVTAMVRTDYATDEAFLSEFNSRNQIALAENSIWYSLITLTTIGYGDMSVSGSLSRIIVVLISISSAVFFPLFIVTVENLLEFSYQETMAYQIFNQIQVKDQMKDSATVLMQKNLKRVQLINKLVRSEKAKKKNLRNVGTLDKLHKSNDSLQNGSSRKEMSSNVDIDNDRNTKLSEKEEKEIGIRLQVIQEEIFDASKEFKEIRMSYRNILFSDFTTENNLRLMLMNEYMVGVNKLAEYHMKHREISPEHYPTDEDYINYKRIIYKASKPKTMETRYYLKDLVEKEYGKDGRRYNQEYINFSHLSQN